MAKTDKANEYQRERSDKKVEDVKKAIRNMIANEEPISIAKVAIKAGVSKSFLYDHKELKELIKQYQPAGKQVLSDTEKLKKALEKSEKEKKALLASFYQAVVEAEYQVRRRFLELQFQLQIYQMYDTLVQQGVIEPENKSISDK